MASVNPVPFDLSKVRNRIIGHVELTPDQILDHPGQAWDHPEGQARALHGILDEVGIVDELLIYQSERAQGAFVTIDGHLRKSLDPRKAWPCTILDLTDVEADYVLATHDPVGQMKKTNAEALDALLSSVSSANAAVQDMFTDIAQRAGLYMEAPERTTDREYLAMDDAQEWRIIVKCASEAAQRELLERFEREGLQCQALIS